MASTDKLRNEQETFSQRVIPLAKQKFDLNLSEYGSLQKCSELLKDIFQLCQNLRRRNISPVMAQCTTLLRRHYRILVPLVGFGAEYLIRQLPLDRVLQEFLANKITFIVSAISVSFRFALVFVFLYQCYELYMVNETIKQAMEVISDEETREKFDQIERNIGRLKEIADEVDRLVELWQAEECDHEKAQLWELISLTLDAATDKEYRETCDTIGELREKIQTQQQMLENGRKVAATGGILSSFGMLSFLAIELIPVVGTIATCASVAGYAIALSVGIDLKKKLAAIRANLEQLSKFDKELEQVMDRIRSQQDWMATNSELDFKL